MCDAWYEPDGDCSCVEEDVEPDWGWDEDQGCYVCRGCGEVC